MTSRLEESTALLSMTSAEDNMPTELRTQSHAQLHRKWQQVCIIRYRWFFSSLLVAGYMIAHIMRFCLGVAIVAMVKPQENATKEYNITDSCVEIVPINATHIKERTGDFEWSLYEQSHVLGSFSYGYIISNILGGRAVELLGVKWSFGGCVFITSILTLLTPVLASTGYVSLMAARILEGLAEGLAIPCIPVFLARWIPKTERAALYSIVHAGGSIGTVISFALTGYLCHNSYSGGWRTAFYIYGSVGVVLSLIWLFFMNEHPQKHRWISDNELSYILQQKGNERCHRIDKLPWQSILKSVPVWTCAFLLFGSLWGSNLIHDLQPTFLHNMFGFSMNVNGFLSALPSLSNVFIVLIAGFISDWISSKNIFTDTNLRKIFNSLGTFLPALCMVGVALSGCNRFAVEVFLILAIGCLAFLTLGVMVAIVNMAPEFSGTITGLCNGIAQISGFLAPLTAGLIINKEQTMANWHTVFYIAAGIHTVAGIIFLIFGSSELQSWAKSENKKTAEE